MEEHKADDAPKERVREFTVRPRRTSERAQLKYQIATGLAEIEQTIDRLKQEQKEIDYLKTNTREILARI